MQVKTRRIYYQNKFLIPCQDMSMQLWYVTRFVAILSQNLLIVNFSSYQAANPLESVTNKKLLKLPK